MEDRPVSYLLSLGFVQHNEVYFTSETGVVAYRKDDWLELINPDTGSFHFIDLKRSTWQREIADQAYSQAKGH